MAVPFAAGQAGLRALAIGTVQHRSLLQFGWADGMPRSIVRRVLSRVS
jgi:hypothetical protein